jgi:hypothetical protein
VTIRANRFDRIGVDAMQLKGFDGLLIEGNEISGVQRIDPTVHPDTIQTFAPGGSNLVIRGNYFHDNNAGVLIKDAPVTGLVVENNIFTRTIGDAYALQIHTAPGARIVNNTFWDGATLLLRGSETPGATVLNNVLERFGYENPALLAVEDYNLIASGPRRGRNSIVGDPRFVAPDRGDFAPRPGSPLIDAGSPLGTKLDFFGHERVRPDIGAVELYQPSAASPEDPCPTCSTAPIPAPPGATTRRPRLCLSPAARIERFRVGPIRLGMTRSQIARAVAAPVNRGRNGLRYCVEGGGRVIVATDARHRARLVLTTAPGYRFGRLHVGASRSLARRELRGRRLGRNMYTERRGRWVAIARIEAGKVAWIAVADRRVAGSARAVERRIARARR